MKLEISCTRAEADHKQLLNCRTTIDGMANGFDKISKLLSISGNEVRLKVLFLLKSLLYFVADLLISNLKFVDILLRR